MSSNRHHVFRSMGAAYVSCVECGHGKAHPWHVTPELPLYYGKPISTPVGHKWAGYEAPTYHATKYDSAAAEVIALLSDEMEGYGQREDTSGEVDAPTGHFALVVIPENVEFSADDEDQANLVAIEYGVTPADVAGVHIVTHNSQGFVSVETFPTRADAQYVFDVLAEEYAEWLGDDDES